MGEGGKKNSDVITYINNDMLINRLTIPRSPVPKKARSRERFRPPGGVQGQGGFGKPWQFGQFANYLEVNFLIVSFKRQSSWWETRGEVPGSAGSLGI